MTPAMARTASKSPLDAAGKPASIARRPRIVADVGVGLLYGQGSDPRLTLELSNDGGVTWTALPTETLGAQGEYGTRVIWNRLGMSPDRVYRCSISDPVPLSVHDTVLELT